MKMKAEILVHFDANSYREIVNFEDEMGSLIRLIGEQYNVNWHDIAIKERRDKKDGSKPDIRNMKYRN